MFRNTIQRLVSTAIVSVLSALSLSCDMRPSIDRQLYEAISRGEVKVLQDYLLNGGDVNRMVQYQTNARYSAPLLHIAVYVGDVGSVMCLLTNGASINQYDSRGEPVMFWLIGAPSDKQSQLLKILLQAGADVNHVSSDYTYSNTPLIHAASVGNTNMIRLLLDAGANVTATNKVGQTALHLAKNAETVKLLIDYGAAIEARSTDGMTPADTAAWLQSTKALSALTNAGFRVVPK